ncbi:30S ribosomal protein S8 [Candidatus Woesearchaeota archaeon]|nr:30S ribosomal protein S8 [Candidatus Woesearchaeota archaeon]
MLNDPIANALSLLVNAERIGRSNCTIRPASKIIETILKILNKKGYVGDYEKVPNNGGDDIVLNLIGKVNKANAIKPNYAISYRDIEKFEKRFLPAKGFGVLVISTSKGIMTNEEAREKKIGGKLLAYCY